MKNKIFSFFIKIFFIIKKTFVYEVERYENCLFCGNKLKGNKRKFCSNDCSNRYWRKEYSKPYKPIMTKKLIKLREKYKINYNGTKDKHKARRISHKKYPSLKGIQCQICKKEKAVHRHHEDYNKPEEIIFVCWGCHGKIHSDFNIDTIQKEVK